MSLLEPSKPPVVLGSTKRRTKISETKLMEMFGRKEADPREAHTSTVATQSTLASEHFHLNQLILEKGPTTTLTTEHARDRLNLQREREHRIIDIWLEEQHQRSRIFVHHRDGLDLLWKCFLSTVPRNRTLHKFGQYGAAGGETTATSRAGSISMSIMRMTPVEEMLGMSTDGLLLPSDTPDGNTTREGTGQLVPVGSSSDAQIVISENKKLKNKITALEKALSKRIMVPGAVVRKRRTASILGSAAPRSFMTVQMTMHMLEEDEELCRGLTTELEAAAWEALVEKHKVDMFHLTTRTVKRQMVVTPYNAYRPRIPMEHSLAGEDFLRKWLLAETFKHYEDLLNMVQHHENDARHGIEMEEESVWLPMWRCFIQPHWQKQTVKQQGVIKELTAELNIFKKESADAKNVAKFSAVEESEEYGRTLILAMASEHESANLQVLRQLESVRGLEVKIATMAKELQRQRWRHRGEVQTLKAQLPYEGLHKKNAQAFGNIAPYTPHCDISLPKSRGINGQWMNPGDPPQVLDGPSASARYIRQQHALHAQDSKETERKAKERKAEAMEIVHKVDKTDDWWAGF